MVHAGENTVMTRQQQFFYDNAGFSYDPKTETAEQGHVRSAERLAEAENFANVQDWYYEVHPDQDADDSWMDNESAEYQRRWRGTAWSVVLFAKSGSYTRMDEVLASLGGCYGDSDYERVVKAELALEAMKPEDFAGYEPAGDLPVSPASQEVARG